MTPNPQHVFDTFSRLTGITIRHQSHGMEAQAIDFCKCFTLDDLTAVVGYVQKEIRGGRLDERSLGWRAFFGNYGSGNDFVAFQDRLSFANKTVRVRAEPKQVATARQVDATSVIVSFQPAPEPATDSIAAETARQLRGLRDGLRDGLRGGA